jgi:signal transduction histidine kinase
MKRFWNDLAISKKIYTLVIVMALFTILTGASYQWLVGQIRDLAVTEATDIMMQDYRADLKNLIDSIAPPLASAAKGITDEKIIHDNFTTLIHDSRFFADNSGYYFIYKVGGTVFVHPTLPDLEGKNIIDKKDQKGNEFIRQLDQVSKGGGGFVEYWFNKPGKGTLPKLSYAKMIPGTHYWIGTGVYIDDVESRKAQIVGTIKDTTNSFLMKLYLIVGNTFLVVGIPLIIMLTIAISKPLRELTQVADRFSIGQLDLLVPGLDRKDEIGNLARSLERLGLSIKKAMEHLQKRK